MISKINKKVRHRNESPSSQSDVNFSDAAEIPIAPSVIEEPLEKMVSIGASQKEKKEIKRLAGKNLKAIF